MIDLTVELNKDQVKYIYFKLLEIYFCKIFRPFFRTTLWWIKMTENCTQTKNDPNNRHPKTPSKKLLKNDPPEKMALNEK